MLKRIRECYKRISDIAGVADALKMPYWAVEKTLRKGHWHGLYDFNLPYRRRRDRQRKEGFCKHEAKERKTKPFPAELFSGETGTRKRRLAVDLDAYEVPDKWGDIC
jgi:hypothetical protein